MPSVEDTYDDLQIIVAETNADLLLSSPGVFAAPLVAEKLRIRWASTVLAPLTFLSAHEPLVHAWLGARGQARSAVSTTAAGTSARKLADRMTRSWGQPVHELRRRLGLPPTSANPLYDGQHSPTLVLAMFSRVLGAVQPDWPPQTRQTGFAFYDGGETGSQELDTGLKRFFDEGPAPIVFTLGSSAVNAAGEFYTASIAAAQALGRRALLLVGTEPSNRRNLPSPLPEGIAVLNYAPYAAVFARSAAVVHQGGAGTVAQALRAGLPSVIVPFNFDQPDNAARIARISAGRVLSRDAYTGPTAADALSQLLNDDAVSRAAQGAAAIIASERAVDVACDALARL